MTHVLDTTSRRDQLLAGVERLTSAIAPGAAEAETATLPVATVQALVESGLLTMKLPVELGGRESDLRTQIEVIERLAYVDPSVAWCAMIGASAIGWAGAFLPASAVAEIFAGGRVPNAAVAVQPTGTATAVPGGFSISGTWAFASGIKHAEWLVASVLVPARGRSAGSSHLVAVFPAHHARVHDDWHVMGLQGTGSCSFSVHDLHVADAFTWNFASARPQRGGPLFRLGWPGFVVHEPAAFALGIARCAMDTVIAASQAAGEEGVLLPSPPAGLGHMMGTAELRWRAARALVLEVFDSAWARVLAGDTLMPRAQAELRAAATFAVDTASDIVREAFRASGSRVVYRTHVVQRCLRDLSAAAQHWLVKDEAYQQHGQYLLSGTHTESQRS